jgi:N-dimethylarginine dimethylaminohydrolase
MALGAQSDSHLSGQAGSETNAQMAQGATSNGKIGPTILMCEPEFFDVTYKINPWMTPEKWQTHSGSFLHEAQHGWQVLRQLYLDSGFAVETVKPATGSPDLVFTANAAIVLNGRVLLARFRFEERRAEEAHFLKTFDRLEAEGKVDQVIFMPEGIAQEGAGDCVFDPTRKLFFAGYGPRSDKKAIPVIEKIFDIPVIPLDLNTPEFYHTDVCICPLSGGHIMFYPGAFSDESRSAIRKAAGNKAIEVSREDADAFALNAVNYGDKIVMAECSKQLEKTLHAAGYEVIKVPVKNFGMAGGSVWCMSLRLDNRT